MPNELRIGPGARDAFAWMREQRAPASAPIDTIRVLTEDEISRVALTPSHAAPPQHEPPRAATSAREPPKPAPSATSRARRTPVKEESNLSKALDAVQDLAAYMDAIPRFAQVVQNFEHNDDLPAYPVRVDINKKEMHGRAVYLDPRRCKDLPDQPRTEENPGFTKASLGVLGKSVKEFGQADQVLVCPIPNDPDFDAQLIDGARRKRSCLLEGRMLLATVTTKVGCTDYDTMFLMSVIRNCGKEPPTKREQMRMATILRDRYQGDNRRIALAMNVDEQTVEDLFKLLTLHPQVQEYLGDSASVEHEGRESRTRNGIRKRLTAAIGLRLVQFTDPEEQFRLAREILDKGMSGAKARRFLDEQGRVAGVKTTPGKHAYRFRALATLTRASLDRFGRYLDMQSVETDRMLATRSTEERTYVGADLRQLAANHLTLAERVEPTPVKKSQDWRAVGVFRKDQIQWVRCAGHPGYRVRLAGITFWWPGYPSHGFCLTATLDDKSWEHLSGEFTTQQQATDAIYEYARQYVQNNRQKAEDALQVLQLSVE